MNPVTLGTLLVAVWVLLWGSLTPANLLGGIAVAAVALYISNGRISKEDSASRAHAPHFRVKAVVVLFAHIAKDLVVANLVVARQIVSRRSSLNTGVVRVPLPYCSDTVLTMITNIMALTPGTMAVEVTNHPRFLYVHILQLSSVEVTRDEIERRSAMFLRAFGSQEELAFFEEYMAAERATRSESGAELDGSMGDPTVTPTAVDRDHAAHKDIP